MEQPPRSDYISRLGTPADYGWARSGADTREEPSRGRLRFVDRARVAARLVARLGETGGARHITRRPPRYCRTCRRWTVLEERDETSSESTADVARRRRRRRRCHCFPEEQPMTASSQQEM